MAWKCCECGDRTDQPVPVCPYCYQRLRAALVTFFATWDRYSDGTPRRNAVEALRKATHEGRSK